MDRRLSLKRSEHSKVNFIMPKSGFNDFRLIVFTEFRAKLDARTLYVNLGHVENAERNKLTGFNHVLILNSDKIATSYFV